MRALVSRSATSFKAPGLFSRLNSNAVSSVNLIFASFSAARAPSRSATNSLSFPVGWTVGYSFSPGLLTIGGLQNGAGTMTQNSYDFTAIIQNPGAAAPELIMMSYVNGGDTAYTTQTKTLQVTNGAPAAVPEPSSWAMMIGGFGLIGAALRRRRKVAAAFG